MKKQRTHKGKGLNLEDWLDREEEKRQLGERTLPINEMDDILPIYDTDGLPFDEDGVFNDVDGMTAAPSEATILKSLEIKNSRYAGMPPLTVGEGTLNDALYGATDYDEAMINNILKEKDTFRFRSKPKSPRTNHVQAFEYVEKVREFYKLEESVYEKRKIKARIKNEKGLLPRKLAIRLFALEEIDKNWFKGYLPFRTYEALKEQAKESLDAADRVYKETTGEDPAIIRKKALDYEVRALWGRNEKRY